MANRSSLASIFLCVLAVCLTAPYHHLLYWTMYLCTMLWHGLKLLKVKADQGRIVFVLLVQNNQSNVKTAPKASA